MVVAGFCIIKMFTIIIMYTGMIGTVVIFITTSMFLLILLMTVLYHYKHGRKIQEEPTYEDTFPPQLPPRPLTTSDNPAYGNLQEINEQTLPQVD